MYDYQKYCGIEFEEGWQDCYTLAKTFYDEILGVSLRDYARPTYWYLLPDFDFFEKLFEREGFSTVSTNANDVRIGDALLMGMGRTEVANHVAIYVGRGQILHHLTGQKSRLEAYSPRWRTRVMRVIRHPKSETVFEGIPAEQVQQLSFMERQRLAARG